MFPRALVGWGGTLSQEARRRKVEAAKQLFELATRVDPQNGNGYYQAAAACLRKGSVPRAMHFLGEGRCALRPLPGSHALCHSLALRIHCF